MIYFKKVKNKIILIKGTKSTRETRRMIVQLSNFEDYNPKESNVYKILHIHRV